MSEPIVTAANFAFISQLLRNHCALVLESGKEYLLRSRLTPVAQKIGVADINQLIERLRQGDDNLLLTQVVEAMVTTETSFFRDLHPFETIRKVVLPELIQRRRTLRQLNIWFAASSSGQEPYSLAMLLNENFPELSNWQINLLGTDISHEMLQRSRLARYSQLEVNRGLPAAMLQKWFRKDGDHWQLDERIRSMVTFSQLNLAQPWPAMPKWDLVFLRNVMIYFDNSVKSNILGRLSRVLHPDGYLLLGGAETTLSLDDSYYRIESLKSGFYQLKP